MNPFVAGLLVCLVVCAGVAGIVAAVARKRITLANARAREVERLAELGTLTGGLAHEIKNPLSTVQLNLQLLAEDIGPENPAYARVSNRLNTVQRETSRLRDILEDFLRYAGKLELERHITEMNGLLEELADFFAPQAQVQKSRLRLMPASEGIFADVDPRLIKQAMLNLMLNSLQAMPQGGELILRVQADGKKVLLDIIDTGKGIMPEAVSKIFDAYYTTKKGGTGLGLAMAFRIIKEHGGTIGVKSEIGKGTVFTITLPRTIVVPLKVSVKPKTAGAS